MFIAFVGFVVFIRGIFRTRLLLRRVARRQGARPVAKVRDEGP